MSTFDLAGITVLQHLDERNEAADEIITVLAKKHAKFDAKTGGFLGLVPFGAAAAFLVQLQRQVKTLFPDLINQLAFVYGTEPDKLVERRAKGWAGLETAGQFMGNEVVAHGVQHLSMQLGTSFLTDLAPDLAVEGGSGAALGMIPILGAGVSAALDYVIAATVTWRVGTMVSLYFQHGGFIGDRKETYSIIKEKLVDFSEETDRTGTCSRIRSEVDPVREGQVARAQSMATTLLSLDPDRDKVRATMCGSGPGQMNIPQDVVDDALAGAVTRGGNVVLAGGRSC